MQSLSSSLKVEEKIEKNSPFFKKFNFFNDVIEYVGEDPFAQLFFHKQIDIKKKETLAFEILKTAKRNIWIGVTQKLEGGIKRFSSARATAYCGVNGYILGEDQFKG